MAIWDRSLPGSSGLPVSRVSKGSRVRCENRFEKDLLSTYRVPKPNGKLDTFRLASDRYSRRPALLHQGSEDILKQKARDSLGRFHLWNRL